jgi:two-component system response regulator PilR (NtrC family)
MTHTKTFSILYAATYQDDLELFSAALPVPNVEIIAAKTVKEALNLSESRRFDLCITETRFHDGGGFELCRQLHEIDRSLPVIFFTGDAGEFHRRLGLQSGAAWYLVKPYFERLMCVVETRLAAWDPGFTRSSMWSKAA